MWLKAQELEGSRLHIFVSPKQLSSTCHVSSLAASDTDHQHKFSLTQFIHFSYLSDDLTFAHKPYDPRPIYIYIPCDVPQQSGGSTQIPSLPGHEPKSVEINAIDTEAIEPEDLEPRRIELDRNLGTDPYQRQERFMRNSIVEDADEFGKVGAEMSWFQSQMHVDYDSAESIADSDLEDGELRNMLASQLYMQNREDCESSRMPIAPGKLAALLQERGVSAKRTQADSRKSLMSSSAQEPRAPGKPAALFSFGSEAPENQFKSSVNKNADPSNLGGELVEWSLSPHPQPYPTNTFVFPTFGVPSTCFRPSHKCIALSLVSVEHHWVRHGRKWLR